MMKPDLRNAVVRLVDDDLSIIKSASFILRQDGWQVRSWTSARDFLIEDMPSDVGCLVLDIRMPGMTGVELQEEMARRGIRLPIIFLSAHGSIDIAVHTMKVGAFDFLQKPIDPEVFLSTVRRAVTEDYYARKLGFSPKDCEPAYASFTDRERGIAVFIASGLENHVIAERLGLSVKTIENHKASIYKKLRISTPGKLALMLQYLNKANGLESAPEERN